MSEARNLYRDLVAVLFLLAAAFLGISLFTYHPADPIPASMGFIGFFYQHDPVSLPVSEEAANACGIWGSLTANVFYNYFGFASYYIVGTLIGVAVWMFRQPYIGSPVLRTAGWFASLVGLATLISLLAPSLSAGPVIGGGGFLGGMGSLFTQQHFAVFGGCILSASLGLAGFLLFSDYTFFGALRLAGVSLMSGVAAAKAVAPKLAANRQRLRTDLGTELSASTGEDVALRAGGQFDSEESADEEALDDESSDRPFTIRIQGRSDLYESVMKPGQPSSSEEDLDEEEYEDELEDEADEDEYEAQYEDEEELDDEDAIAETKPTKSNLPVASGPHFKIKKKGKKDKEDAEREDVMHALDEAALAEQELDYQMPDIRMLSHGEGPSYEDQEREVRRKAVILEKTFKQFGFTVKVVEIETGPVIAQYEIELEAGLRLAKITNLADDIAIALRVPSVRIVAPIPGKNTVGIEVPNEHRQMVCLRDVMEEAGEKTNKMKIPLFLGKDVSGNPLVVDLATLPHLLIAGRTGTGKSVCLNAIISSILMTRRPDEVRMLMIDPKMVELSGYARLPHLMHPVVTDMRKAEAILAWAVDKMEERYALLARAGVRHISSYNQLGEEELFERMEVEDDEEKKEIPRTLPFIVIVADEMADLMMTSGKEVEQHIIRLAQKSRAVGIHLILATQKPTVDVITGLIKSNLPSRIAFQVASRTDSRVVLDEMGADKLLGNGDMLFLWPGTSTLLRGQGTYLSDQEIDRITETVSSNHQAFVPELVNLQVDAENAGGGTGNLKDRDDLYESAIDIVVKEGRGSLSLLQRALGIGYGRAARLIDFMAEDGIVGTYNGSKSRDVLIDAAEWERMRSGADGEDDDPPPSPKPRKPKTKLQKKSAKAAPIVLRSPGNSYAVQNQAEVDDADYEEDEFEVDEFEEEVLDEEIDDEDDQWEEDADDEEYDDEDDVDVAAELEDEADEDEENDQEWEDSAETDDEYKEVNSEEEYEDDDEEESIAAEHEEDDYEEDDYEEDASAEEDEEYEANDFDEDELEDEESSAEEDWEESVPKPSLYVEDDDEFGDEYEDEFDDEDDFIESA